MDVKLIRRGTIVRQVFLLLVLGLASLALLPNTVLALGDTTQVLTGGNSGAGPAVRYTAPGLANIYNADFPATGLGESAAQVRMPAGRISALRVSVKTEGIASTGSVTVTVRVNGANTALSCSVGKAGGTCNGPAGSVAVAGGAGLAVRINSTLNTGFYTFSYSFLFD